MNNNPVVPNWYREIDSFKGVTSTFILEGNIYDKYPKYSERFEDYDFYNLNELLEKFFNSEDKTYDFIYYDPSLGFFDPLEESNDLSQKLIRKNNSLNRLKEGLSGFNINKNDINDKHVKDSEIIRATISPDSSAGTDTQPYAIVLNFASRFASSPDNLTENEISFFLNLQYASNNAASINCENKNTLILLVDKVNDIPAWFYINNPNIRKVTVPNPDRETRKVIIDKYYSDYFKDKSEVEKEKYIDLTDGMKCVEIESLSYLLDNKKDEIYEVSDLISIYKYGFKDNKWAQIRNKLQSIDLEEEIHKSVKGQDVAVKKAVSIIKRAVMGISGLQHSSGTKPKGIMFLAGTTGTGKTELVKAITRALFEDERALVRFDMSEYGEENSDQKLFGAPPGYVGYGQGGQLTNAIRANPFSILLFDEIEKADTSIMDKFLQILEDGRMTDGQGNTVYFSECMIFFTSNIGTYRNELDASGEIKRIPTIMPGDDYEEICSRVTEALKKYFKPEVYGRIGEGNFVVFDTIDETLGIEILNASIDRICKRIKKEQQINISFQSDAKQWLNKNCTAEKYLVSGGRGIGNAIEELFLNVLGEFLFDNISKNVTDVVVSVSNDEKLMFAISG